MLGAAALVLVLFLAAWVVRLDFRVREQFAGERWQVPARIYARPLELYRGRRLTAADLELELRAAGYLRAAALRRQGSYVRAGDRFEIWSRRFRFWDGAQPEYRLSLRLRDGRVGALDEGAKPVTLVRLVPALIGHLFPARHEDRVLVRLRDVPPALVATLIAVEDRGFYRHHGVSLRGIARAAWTNLRAGRTVEGGSTLTQQLAKNFFLSPRRTLGRKLEEALIALVLEAHFGKRAILQAYLNEVFLGQDGRRSVHGFGLAAEFYFGRPIGELRAPEIALLVGMVRGPSYYDPRRHPRRARERRDLVLGIMARQGIITARQAARARRAPLGVRAMPPPANTPYPAFVDLVRRQLGRDYRSRDLRSDGLRIFTTLAPSVQAAAEAALQQRLAALGRRARTALEGAVVVTDPQTGEVLALVGGRDPRDGGFDRALDAVRPIGSLVKPAIYLTALARDGGHTLISPLEDLPISVQDGNGARWVPANFERRSHGRVPLYLALAHSYNQATVRLGMQLGLARVIATLHALGIERAVPEYPSLLLGALSLSPVEVAQMYQSIASGGFRTPLRTIRSVTDPFGHPLARYGLSVRQAFAPAPVFVLKRAMGAVLRVGTARGAYRRLPRSWRLAGKTGTTNDLRDSWFAGFGSRLLAVVWVGRDDDGPTTLTGATGALRVWTDLMLKLHPESLTMTAPKGIEWDWVDVAADRSTDPGCPGSVRMPFLDGTAPPASPCRGGVAGSPWREAVRMPAEQDR